MSGRHSWIEKCKGSHIFNLLKHWEKYLVTEDLGYSHKICELWWRQKTQFSPYSYQSTMEQFCKFLKSQKYLNVSVQNVCTCQILV